MSLYLAASGQDRDDPEPRFPRLEHPAPNAHGDAVALGVCAQPRGGRRWSSPETSGRSTVRAGKLIFASEEGIEVQCRACRRKVLVPFESLAGREHLVRFVERWRRKERE